MAKQKKTYEVTFQKSFTSYYKVDIEAFTGDGAIKAAKRVGKHIGPDDYGVTECRVIEDADDFCAYEKDRCESL